MPENDDEKILRELLDYIQKARKEQGDIFGGDYEKGIWHMASCIEGKILMMIHKKD